jgi:hypothetical protein
MKIQNKLTGKFLTVRNDWYIWDNEGSLFNQSEINAHLNYFNNSKRLKVISL